MDDSELYKFEIENFSPETMPFGRLVEYYAEIKRMLGHTDGVHLIDVQEGCHASCFKVDARAKNDFEQRLVQIASDTAPRAALRARDTINEMLREDGTRAEFVGSFVGNVIEFPGKLMDQDVVYTARDAATFVGELYHIAGSDDGVRLRVSTDDSGVVFCKTSREVGRSIRGFLFERVRITGRGLWTRTRNGEWAVRDMTVTEFSPVPKDDLRATLEAVRRLPIDWPDDPIAMISDVDERGGQVH